MSRLPRLTPADVIRVLEGNGFHRITERKKHRMDTDGDHIVAVPFHRRGLKQGTLRAIIRQAGWTVDEFLEKVLSFGAMSS
jgi:predicted RNA binding protein YcfA (HicA-like mRNA interferase family)